jgi:hypothetical protein
VRVNTYRPKLCQDHAWFLYQAMGIHGILVSAIGVHAGWLQLKSS